MSILSKNVINLISLISDNSNDYMGRINNANSQREVFTVCSSFAEELEVSYFSYGAMWSDDFHHIKHLIMSNYESDWLKEYKENSYHLIDPRIKKSIISTTPVFWSTDDSYLRKLSSSSKRMMIRAHEHNIRAGVTVPLHNPQHISGIFGVGLNANMYSGEESIKHLKHITPFVSYLGTYIHESMIRILELNKTSQQEQLTVREKDCLCWAADGKTATEIASRLCIAESTVKYHFKNIMKKLGAHNTSQALAIAIFRGYIGPVL